MGYIYCITNLINSKRYIGKTTSNIDYRFQEHRKDSKKERRNKRPLYDAMNKYGVENFKIEELEQIDDPTLLSDREKYWIKELNTWGHTGYNASKGGDGTVLYDYKEIIELYNMGYSQKQVAQKVGCCDDTVSKILKAHNIPIRGSSTKKQTSLIWQEIIYNHSLAQQKWLNGQQKLDQLKAHLLKDTLQNAVTKKLSLHMDIYGDMLYFHKSSLSY